MSPPAETDRAVWPLWPPFKDIETWAVWFRALGARALVCSWTLWTHISPSPTGSFVFIFLSGRTAEKEQVK